MEANEVKLYFALPENRDGVGTESMWARTTDDHKLIILNSPFYTKGVSYLDKVDYSVENGVFVFSAIVKKSGHSTYRILQQNEEQFKRFEEYWKPIENLGATYESKVGDERLYSIDVPSDVDIEEVFRLLEKGEQQGVWFFEEADFGRADR